MTVLDAYAVVAFIADEFCAPEVQQLLDGPESLWLSAPNLAETVDVLSRVRGHPSDDILSALKDLRNAGLVVAEADETLSVHAGQLRAKYYDRSTCAVSMGDCMALALALKLRRPLATSDPSLAAVSRLESLSVIPLPDSSGRRP